MDQWRDISRIVRDKGLLPFFDTAYHGLCSGSVHDDTAPIRLFAEDGHLMIVSQSFSKNMGIYGDRVGALTIMCDHEDEVYRVTSQLKNIIISKYICPPSQSGRVVATVLGDRSLRDEWTGELVEIASRIQSIRQSLRDKLESALPNHQSWHTVTEQSGIFWYSGLSGAQVEALINEHSIYLCEDGRVNVAGVDEANVDHLVAMIADVVQREAR